MDAMTYMKNTSKVVKELNIELKGRQNTSVFAFHFNDYLSKIAQFYAGDVCIYEYYSDNAVGCYFVCI